MLANSISKSEIQIFRSWNGQLIQVSLGGAFPGKVTLWVGFTEQVFALFALFDDWVHDTFVRSSVDPDFECVLKDKKDAVVKDSELFSAVRKYSHTA